MLLHFCLTLYLTQKLHKLSNEIGPLSRHDINATAKPVELLSYKPISSKKTRGGKFSCKKTYDMEGCLGCCMLRLSIILRQYP